MRKLAWLAMLCALLAACSGPSAAGPTNAPTAAPVARATPAAQPTADSKSAANLSSATWKWKQTVGAAGDTTTVSSPDKFTVQFLMSGSRVGIGTQCQSATGSYTTNGHALKITIEGMTNAVCPGDTLSDQFIAQLGGVESYSFDGSDLVLQLQGGTGSLRLTH